MELDELTPARVLLLRYMIDSQLTAPGSISGHQADRLRSGLGGAPQDGGRVNGQEALHAKLGDLLLLCRGLSPLEERVCRLRYGAAAGSLPYTLLRRLCDLREGDGEDIVDLRPQGPDGSPMPGWVTVRGVRARYPSNQEIGDKLGLTARQVQRHLEDARAKVATAIQWHRFAQMQESRYT